MNTFERALDWLARFQPAVADAVAARRDKLQDFLFFKGFSYGCTQVWDGQARWALTGEAGGFLDPFYSPGADFIAMANTFIVELVRAERAGEPLRAPSLYFNELFLSFYDSTLTLYQDQYALFGEPRVMPVKVLWDYTYYWGVLCQIFFQGRRRGSLLEGMAA